MCFKKKRYDGSLSIDILSDSQPMTLKIDIPFEELFSRKEITIRIDAKQLPEINDTEDKK